MMNLRIRMLMRLGAVFFTAAFTLGCDDRSSDTLAARGPVQDSSVDSKRVVNKRLRADDGVLDLPGAIERTAQMNQLGLSAAEIDREVELMFGSALIRDPNSVLEEIEKFRDPSARCGIRDAVIRVMTEINLLAATDIVLGRARGQVAPGAIDHLVLTTLRKDPSRLDGLALLLDGRNDDALRGGIADYYRQDLGVTGRFPQLPRLPGISGGQEALKSYLKQGGAPRNASELDSWRSGSEAFGVPWLASEACKVYGERAPNLAAAYYTEKFREISEEEKLGLIQGISRKNPNEAATLALREGEPQKYIEAVVEIWMQKDAFEASRWINELEAGETKNVAIRRMIVNLKKRGNADGASAWGEMISSGDADP